MSKLRNAYIRLNKTEVKLDEAVEEYDNFMSGLSVEELKKINRYRLLVARKNRLGRRYKIFKKRIDEVENREKVKIYQD